MLIALTGWQELMSYRWYHRIITTYFEHLLYCLSLVHVQYHMCFVERHPVFSSELVCCRA